MTVIGIYTQKYRPKGRAREQEGGGVSICNREDRWKSTYLQWSGGILGTWVIRKLASLLHDALDGWVA
jgi:hypothetical protein